MSVHFFDLSEGAFTARRRRLGETGSRGGTIWPRSGNPAAPDRARALNKAAAHQDAALDHALAPDQASVLDYASVLDRPLKLAQPVGRMGARYRVLGLGLTGAGVAMVPWLFVLARTLPAQAHAAHWHTVWIGLDSLEALGLVSTGLLLRRRDARAGLTAAATASLLAIDAWFDVLTCAPGGDRAVAIAMAAGAELPMAALCAVLAVRLYPRLAITPDDAEHQRAKKPPR